MSDSYLPKIFEGFPELADKAKALEAALEQLAVAAQNAQDQPAGDTNAIDAAMFAAIESERDSLKSQVEQLEAAQVPEAPAVDNSEQLNALTDEVAHWKDKYDGLAGRFDAEIEAANAGSVDQSALDEKQAAVDEKQSALDAQQSALAEKDGLIASLEESKSKAADEIARLASDLAQARSQADAAQRDAQSAQGQLANLNSELSAVKTDLDETPEATEAVDTSEFDSKISGLEEQVASLASQLAEKDTALADALAKAEGSEAARAKAAARLNALIESLNVARNAGAA